MNARLAEAEVIAGDPFVIVTKRNSPGSGVVVLATFQLRRELLPLRQKKSTARYQN